MSWIHNHLDFLMLITAGIIAFCSYWIGDEVGYRKGLDDGFRDGALNGRRP